ncbi:MAG: hypothetical protein ABIW76_13830 [Fibrobacteria bacterium]
MPAILAAFLGMTLASASPPDPLDQKSSTTVDSRPGLAILDPVDVAADKATPRFGDILRSGAEAAGKFAPLPRAQMESKMAEFSWDSTTHCHEFQCGFDAGSMLLTEYVLFGTITPLEGIFAYTFNVMHVPSGQVVRAEAGDVSRSPGNAGDAPLKAKLTAFASGLDPAQLDLTRKTSRGLMAVVDLSSESPESRVLSERVSTHVNASRHYDLMSRKELQELLSAMEIPLHDIQTSDSGMIALGTRLNVAYLVHSKLRQDSRETRLDLALFDIAGKRRIRDWPSNSKRGFQEILHHENRFFTTLNGPSKEVASRSARKAGSHRSNWSRGFLSTAGVFAAAGLSAIAWVLHTGANDAHTRAEESLSVEKAQAFKAEAQEKDERTVWIGGLAALSLGASVVVWTF